MSALSQTEVDLCLLFLKPISNLYLLSIKPKELYLLSLKPYETYVCCLPSVCCLANRRNLMSALFQTDSNVYLLSLKYKNSYLLCFWCIHSLSNIRNRMSAVSQTEGNLSTVSNRSKRMFMSFCIFAPGPKTSVRYEVSKASYKSTFCSYLFYTNRMLSHNVPTLLYYV
jgi:hypothetical protein